MSNERGMIEFWVPDEELKKIKDAGDHHFAFGWGSKQEEPVLYIDGESVKIAPGPARDVRFHSVIRSAAWIKATYLSSLEKLVSFGKEEKR